MRTKAGLRLRLAALAYFEVCAGPFSIELAVRAAGGPLATLIGIPLLLVLWVIPVIEVTARLVEITSHKDGGCIVWVTELLGPLAGHVNVYLTVVANTVDLALYPAIVTGYIGAHGADRAAIIMAIVALGISANLLGIKGVSWSHVVAGVIVLVPVIGWIIRAAPDVLISRIGTSLPVSQIDYALLTSTLFWNMVGFTDSASATKTMDATPADYRIAFIGAAVMSALTYIGPVFIAAGTLDDYANWHVGSLIEAATAHGGQLVAASLLGAAVLANGMQFLTTLALASRATRAAAISGVLPRFMTSRYKWRRESVPWAAIITQGVLSGILALIDVSDLVEAAALTINAGLILVAMAMFSRRAREAGWGYLPGVAAVMVCMVVLTAAVFQSWQAWVVLLGIILFAAGDFRFRKWMHMRHVDMRRQQFEMLERSGVVL